MQTNEYFQQLQSLSWNVPAPVVDGPSTNAMWTNPTTVNGGDWSTDFGQQYYGGGQWLQMGGGDQETACSHHLQQPQFGANDYHSRPSTSSSMSSAPSSGSADAISALASLAQNPIGSQTAVGAPSTFGSTFKEGAPATAWQQGALLQHNLGMNGGDPTAAVQGSQRALMGRPPPPQLNLHEFLPDSVRTVEHKQMLEVDQQKRGWNDTVRFPVIGYPQQAPDLAAQNSAFRSPGGVSFWSQSSARQPANLLQQYSLGMEPTPWRRFLSPADQLAPPVIHFGPTLQKIAEWQLSALLARQTIACPRPTSSSAAAAANGGQNDADESSNASAAIPTHLPSATSDVFRVVRPPITEMSTARDRQPSTSTSSSGASKVVLKSEDNGVKDDELPPPIDWNKLLVCRDVERTFDYRLAAKEGDAPADDYFAGHVPVFVDGNFNVRPCSDQITTFEGSFEPEDSRKHRLDNNIAQKTDQCKCLGSEVSEELEGPYYTHLAAGPSVSAIRRIMETRFGQTGSAIRIEKVVYTGKEGRTQDGCPLAKWIIRRSGPEEKLLCLVRERPGHRCATAVLCVFLCLWDGVPGDMADDLYSYLSRVLPSSGMPTNRRCALNEQRTCACQGMDDVSCGASYSFGCSWSMYYNTCKFARSRNPKRFKLMDPAEEPATEMKLQKLSDRVAEQYAMVAPASYRNQTYFSYRAGECRLGNHPNGPFTGLTACVDFCSHSHRDVHNMSNGCTVVVTLTDGRGSDKDDDEQLHVLPLYIPAKTDEHGSEEGQKRKMEGGGIETLTKYPMVMRYRKDPLPNCKERNKRPCPSSGNQASTTRASPTFGSPHHMKQEAMSPATSANYYNPYGMSSFQQPMYPPQGFANYPMGNGFYHSYAPMGWNAPPQYGYPTPMQQDYCGWQQQPQQPQHPQHQQHQQQQQQQQQHARPDQQIYGDVNVLKRKASFGPDMDEMCGNGLKTNGHNSATPPDPDAPPAGFYTQATDNDHAFADPQIGGIAIAATHGSILFEVAKKELHATTALKHPDRRQPKRISLVFYQHKNMNFMNHGFEEWDRKLAAKKLGKPDTVGTTRAAATKHRFDLQLPQVRAPPIAEELRTAVVNRCTTVVDCRPFYTAAKTDASVLVSDAAASSAKLPPNGSVGR